MLGNVHLRFHFIVLAGRLDELSLFFTFSAWWCGNHIIFRNGLSHELLSFVFHVVLAKHGVATLTGRDVLHPLLVFSFHVPVVVNLPKSWLHRHLSSICDFNFALLFLLLFCLWGLFLFGFLFFFLFNRFVVLHLGFKVTEALLRRWNWCWSRCLLLSLRKLFDQHVVGLSTLEQPILNLGNKLSLLNLKLADLVTQILSLL
jgi:hypothetical protein